MTKKAFDAVRKVQSETGYFTEYKSKDETPEAIVKHLISLLPLERADFVIDAGSGKNKVWFRNIPTERKDEYEIEDGGRNFLEFDGRADWVIGNPPFREYIRFCYHCCDHCNKGFAFMINHMRLNQLTTKRLADFEARGFFLSGIHIFDVKAWFGRYYFLTFTRRKSSDISYSRKIETAAKPIPPTDKSVGILGVIL